MKISNVSLENYESVRPRHDRCSYQAKASRIHVGFGMGQERPTVQVAADNSAELAAAVRVIAAPQLFRSFTY
jgi:hypothetical protein